MIRDRETEVYTLVTSTQSALNRIVPNNMGRVNRYKTRAWYTYKILNIIPTVGAAYLEHVRVACDNMCDKQLSAEKNLALALLKQDFESLTLWELYSLHERMIRYNKWVPDVQNPTEVYSTFLEVLLATENKFFNYSPAL